MNTKMIKEKFSILNYQLQNCERVWIEKNPLQYEQMKNELLSMYKKINP
jgi:hypothetical protein